MLPKILIGGNLSKEIVRDYAGIDINFEIAYDGSEGNLSEFRDWLSFASQTIDRDTKYFMIIWNADRLSRESQSLLLKPLEEKKESRSIFLISSKEDGILQTIRSRCLVEKVDTESGEYKYWLGVVSCWKKGPAECIKFSESNSQKEVVVNIIEEVIQKLSLEIQKKVNRQRLEIIDMAFGALKDMNDVNVNSRLCLEDFLIRSWRETLIVG